MEPLISLKSISPEKKGAWFYVRTFLEEKQIMSCTGRLIYVFEM